MVVKVDLKGGVMSSIISIGFFAVGCVVVVVGREERNVHVDNDNDFW